MVNAYQADVVVIGGGLAGIVTSLELLDSGKKVVLLERASEQRFGGLAKRSFGGIFFVDSPEQRRSGVHDTVDLAWQDWIRYGELDARDTWPWQWAQAYVHRCTEEVRAWLADFGVSWLPVVNWTERGYFVPGNSVPRFHITWGTGPGIVLPLIERLRTHERSGTLQLKFDHHVQTLDSHAGAIAGCHGKSATGDFEARAPVIIIAAGGIAGNHEKIRALWPRAWPTPSPLLNGSSPEADGHMLDEAARHGAVPTHLETMWNYAAGVRHWNPLFANHGLSLVPMKSALWLGYDGQRFTDPPLVGSYDTSLLVSRVAQQKKPYSWLVLNRRIADREFAVSGAESNRELRDKQRLRFVSRMLFGSAALVQEFIDHCPDFLSADALPELVEKMNELAQSADVNLERVEQEIARYDENVRRPRALQNDDQIRRILHARQYRGDRLRTCKPTPIIDTRALPLIAIRAQLLTRKSLGGLRIDLQARVLDARDQPISGLYAVGEATGFGGGGMHGKRALEGTFLGGCIFSGRIAARAIVSGRGVG